MGAQIRRVQYFYATVADKPGQAYALLSKLSDAGVDLLAFSVIPMGTMQTQLQLFPAAVDRLISAARELGMTMAGPQHALLIQGDDTLGALVEVHHLLAEAEINVYASNGVTDGRGGYGYLIYVKPDAYERAARVLGV